MSRVFMHIWYANIVVSVQADTLTHTHTLTHPYTLSHTPLSFNLPLTLSAFKLPVVVAWFAYAAIAPVGTIALQQASQPRLACLPNLLLFIIYLFQMVYSLKVLSYFIWENS